RRTAAAANRRPGRRWPASRGRGSRPRPGTRRSSRGRGGAAAATAPAPRGAGHGRHRRAAGRRCRGWNTWDAPVGGGEGIPAPGHEKARIFRCGLPRIRQAWSKGLRLVEARIARTVARRIRIGVRIAVRGGDAGGQCGHAGEANPPRTALQQLQTKPSPPHADTPWLPGEAEGNMGVNDTVQQLSRASQVVAMLARYRKAGILAGLDLGDAVEPEAHTGAGDDAMAERFAADLEALGPAFVKLGQALSTRPDLVPAGWIAALERIQDDATPAPIGDIEALLGHELGVRAGKVFSAIDPEPMAAASLAQVHRAVLRDGRVVALKIQRPDVAAGVRADLDLLARLAGTAD